VLLLLLIVVRSGQPAYAWNSTGHKAISLLAYQRLTPAVRQRIDGLLAKHPDYSKWTEGVPAGQRGRAAFLAASVWPDNIRNDPRFHNDDQAATPAIPGLPEGAQARHAEWHYIDLPFSTDATPTVPPSKSNALMELKELQSVEHNPEQMQVYLLPWVLHLVEDVHQPLHTMMRFTANDPNGDRGGNTVRVKDASNLHGYWDGRLGNDNTDSFLDELSETLRLQAQGAVVFDMNPEHWVNEGFALRQQVYSFIGTGTLESPAVPAMIIPFRHERLLYSAQRWPAIASQSS
jgi:S1/P1 Nuclease